MAAKYQGKNFYNFGAIPADIRVVSRDYFKRLTKTYGAVTGGYFFVETPTKVRMDYNYAPAMLAEKPEFGQAYLATEADGSGLDAQYANYDGGVVWAAEQKYLEDVYQVSLADEAGTVYGPPTWLDGKTFTAEQIPSNVEFVSHKDFFEIKASAKFAILHTGKFLLQCFANSRSNNGFLVPCGYFVVNDAPDVKIYATEKPDDETEQGRYFFNRERFANNLAGELAFQAWTATQGDFWGWEMKIAVDKAEDIAVVVAKDGATIVGQVVTAAADGLETLILHDPLVIVMGVVVIGVVAYAATR